MLRRVWDGWGLVLGVEVGVEAAAHLLDAAGEPIAERSRLGVDEQHMGHRLGLGLCLGKACRGGDVVHN